MPRRIKDAGRDFGGKGKVFNGEWICVSAASVTYTFCSERGSHLGCILQTLVKTDCWFLFVPLYSATSFNSNTTSEAVKTVSETDQVCQEKQKHKLINRKLHAAYKCISPSCSFPGDEKPSCHVTSTRGECLSFLPGQEETEVVLMKQII